MVILKDLNVLS